MPIADIDVVETAVTLVELCVGCLVVRMVAVDMGAVVVEETPGWVLFTTVHNETQIG